MADTGHSEVTVSLTVLRDEIRSAFESHNCQFQPEEVRVIRDFVDIYKETRSIVLKAAIGGLLFLLLVLVILGVKNNFINPGGK